MVAMRWWWASGHADFAPVDPQEIAVYEILKARFGRVSEQLLSGAGLLHIYRALAQLANNRIDEQPEQVQSSSPWC